MNVVMVGTGYVGLVSGACIAEFGANVVCVDMDASKIEQLNLGQIPIYEPGLDSLVTTNVETGRLRFTVELEDAVRKADLIFISVGTPSRRGDGFADLSFVYDAAEQIAGHLSGYTVIVDKSTVPVGTARNVARIIQEASPEADFDVASNPEFLREGAAIADFMRPDRVVLGVENERAEGLLRDLYRPVNSRDTPILVTDLETAELIKYAANAFLATKISFINEVSMLCEAVGADVQLVAQAMGMDARIGAKFLSPGPGYGGSCFPKDTQAYVRMAQEYGAGSRIVESVIEVNSAQKARMIQKIRSALGGSEFGKTLGVLGLTFKPETDDMREAPAISILPPLMEKGAMVRAHDPKGMREAQVVLPRKVHYCEGVYEVCDGSDALILLTEWDAYRSLDLGQVRQVMHGNIFIDLRNVYERKVVEEYGFRYHGVGR